MSSATLHFRAPLDRGGVVSPHPDARFCDLLNHELTPVGFLRRVSRIMPEEIFDVLEDIFDERKKRKKRRKRREREIERRPPERRSDRDRPAERSEPKGLMGRVTSMFRSASEPPPAPQQPEPEPDPRQQLDTTYREQLRLLEEVRQSVDNVTAAKDRLQRQFDEAERRLSEFDELARRHLDAGREDLARVAIERKQLAVAQLDDFERQIETLAQEQTQLMRAEARLEAKIEAFRARREVVSSQYAAAQAQARLGDAAGGLNEEMADVNYSVRRVESRTAELRSRGQAIDQMINEGLLEGDDPQARFDRKMRLMDVDDELERLKRQDPELPPGTERGR